MHFLDPHEMSEREIVVITVIKNRHWGGIMAAIMRIVLPCAIDSRCNARNARDDTNYHEFSS